MENNIHTEKPKRVSLPKSTRFEVFKRDSFKCQYCGAAAPNVLLEIDHINPVSNGGENDILNLITACKECNRGKKDTPLQDHAVINKKKAQLDELQEHREQLELLVQWHEGLQDIKTETASKIADYWTKQTPGYHATENGIKTIKTWLKKFSFEDIMAAIDIAAAHYLKYNEENNLTPESINEAFNKISGICFNKQREIKDPTDAKLYYIRGILRNRLNYINPNLTISWLRAAHKNGTSLEKLQELALTSPHWTAFREALGQ